MTLTFKEYLNLVFIGYFLLLLFTAHSTLIAKQICENKRTHKRRKKNFLWGWAIIVITMTIAFFSIYIQGIHKYSPNLKNGLFFALLPLITSCLIMIYWRYHGPVITFFEGKPVIQECKFLFTFSKHYDIKYDTFYLTYSKNDHFISEKFEQAYFQIRFNCVTLDQLYLYFIPLFQKVELEYTASEQHINDFFYYVQEEIITTFRNVVIKNISSIEDESLYNPSALLKIIKTELSEKIVLEYGVTPIINELSFYGVRSGYTISGLVNKDGAYITKD